MLLRLLRIVLCLISPCFATAQTMAEIALQAAARISSLLPSRATVSFESQNLSTLSAVEFSAFRSALEAETKKTEIEIQAVTQPETQVRVVLSQNVHGLIIVGEVRTGERRQTFFLPWMPPQAAAPSPVVRLEQRNIWEQPEPILDFALLNSGSQLLVLGVSQVSLYQIADGKWRPAGSAQLQLSAPLARDPRGRLLTDQNLFHVYLPATTCSGSAREPVGVSCVPGNEAWETFRWVSGRNYLEMVGAQNFFYTAALGDNGARAIFASLDGRVHDPAHELVDGAAGWGSDLAGPMAACGLSTIVVATKAGDRDSSDSLQPYDLANGGARSAGEPVPVPGPVTALWPSEDRGQVSVVVRNLRTGNYEASRLHLACAE